MFILDSFVPWPGLLKPARSLALRDFSLDAVRVSAVEVDSLTQAIAFREVSLTRAGLTILPVQGRYCWPSELDLMAKLAGMGLTTRYATYDKEPMHHRARHQVAVYERVDPHFTRDDGTV